MEVSFTINTDSKEIHSNGTGDKLQLKKGDEKIYEKTLKNSDPLLLQPWHKDGMLDINTSVLQRR